MLDAHLHAVDTPAPALPSSADGSRPSRQEAEAAVRTLIRWGGDRMTEAVMARLR